MLYYKIKFNNDYPISEGYMEVDDSAGQMSRLTDLDGNTLNITAQWASANPLNSIYTDMFNLYRVF